LLPYVDASLWKILDHRGAFRFQAGQLFFQEFERKETLTVVVSIVVHCCAIKKNVTVASRLYDAADVQFTIEKEGPLELLQFIQKYNLRNSVPNIVITEMLRIFPLIAGSFATCDKSCPKLKLIKNYLRSILSTWRLRNLAILSIIEQRFTDKIDFDIAIEEFPNKKARKVTV